MDKYHACEVSKSATMDEEGVLQTLSKQVTGPVEHSPVRVIIEWHIKKFASMLTNYKPGEDLWSKGVSSELVKGAVWKLRLYPNGNDVENAGCLSVFLYLTGPMADKKESLRASYHLFLDAGGGVRDPIARDTKIFDDKHSFDYHYGERFVSYDRVRGALRDGSLVVVAEVKFLAPKLDSCSSCSC